MVLEDPSFEANYLACTEGVYIVPFLLYGPAKVQLILSEHIEGIMECVYRNNFITVFGELIQYDGKETIFVQPGNLLYNATDNECNEAREHATNT